MNILTVIHQHTDAVNAFLKLWRQKKPDHSQKYSNMRIVWFENRESGMKCVS